MLTLNFSHVARHIYASGIFFPSILLDVAMLVLTVGSQPFRGTQMQLWDCMWRNSWKVKDAVGLFPLWL